MRWKLSLLHTKAFLTERGDVMKNHFIIAGVILLVATIVLVVLGFVFRSKFYGIMDAPFSVYGKYGTYARICFVIGIITGLLSVISFVLGIIRYR